MDARKDRIGEHAAEHALPWAVGALGPVPDDPIDRLDWQRRASSIGAYRELSGYDHPAEPIGPEPVAAAPDIRAAWHEALAALGPVDGPDVRGMPDGTLLHLRDTYPIETAWAPQWVGDELRQVRLGATGSPPGRPPRHRRSRRRPEPGPARASQPSAGAGRQLPGHARRLPRTRGHLRRGHGRQAGLGAGHPLRSGSWPWRADAELRRRHPGQQHPPLRSAEPQPATQEQRGELTLTAAEEIPQLGQWIQDLAVAAPRLRRQAGRTAEPDDPSRRPGLRRHRPGLLRLDRHTTGTRSCSRLSRRSSRRRGYWNASRTAIWTWKPPNDGPCKHHGTHRR